MIVVQNKLSHIYVYVHVIFFCSQRSHLGPQASLKPTILFPLPTDC